MSASHRPHRASPRFVVLHGLRIKGRAGTEELAKWSLRPEPDVAGELAGLAGGGRVAEVTRPGPAWTLTDAGRSDHQGELDSELADQECGPCRRELESAFERFLSLNDDLLEAVSAWQVRPFGSTTVPNDHSEPAYDAGVLRRVGSVHNRVAPALQAAAGVLERLRPYEDRLAGALGRCRAGDHAWLASPRVESYHTVWFELHEDLLVSLGRSRSQSSSQQ